jgi:SAM-dependent methyltransferase
VLDTTAAVSAEHVLQFTMAMWQHALDRPGDPVAEADGIRRTIAAVGPDRGRELRALVERVDALPTERRRQFIAAIDEVQVRSKLWLIDELAGHRDLAGTTVVVLGAWYGTLPLLLNWRLARPPVRMVCLDIDADACALGAQVIGALYPGIEYRVGDAMDLDYDSLARDPATVLVNTICEHLIDAVGWWARIPAGQLCLLQSNNYDRCRDHVNCVRNLDEMKAQTPMSTLLFEGVLKLSIFDRFMLIGYR